MSADRQAGALLGALVMLASCCLAGCAGGPGRPPAANGAPRRSEPAPAAGQPGFESSQPWAGTRASSDLAEIEDLYIAGEFAAARDAFRAVAAGAPGSVEGAWAFLWLGRCEYALGRLGAARAALEHAAAANEGARDGDLLAYALSTLAEVALAQGRPAEALAHLDRMRTDRIEGRVDGAAQLFRRARALEAVGRWDDARTAYRRVAHVWPDRAVAREADSMARSGAVYETRAGVFANRSTAEATGAALRLRGFHVRVEAEGPARDRRYAVLLGRFVRDEDARRLADRAASEGIAVEVLPSSAPEVSP